MGKTTFTPKQALRADPRGARAVETSLAKAIGAPSSYVPYAVFLTEYRTSGAPREFEVQYQRVFEVKASQHHDQIRLTKHHIAQVRSMGGNVTNEIERPTAGAKSYTQWCRNFCDIPARLMPRLDPAITGVEALCVDSAYDPRAQINAYLDEFDAALVRVEDELGHLSGRNLRAARWERYKEIWNRWYIVYLAPLLDSMEDSIKSVN